MTVIRSFHEIANVLRDIADRFQAAGDAPIPATYLDVSLQVLRWASGGDADTAPRIAAVNAVAAVMGTTPVTGPADGADGFHRSAPCGDESPVLAFTAVNEADH